MCRIAWTHQLPGPMGTSRCGIVKRSSTHVPTSTYNQLKLSYIFPQVCQVCIHQTNMCSKGLESGKFRTDPYTQVHIIDLSKNKLSGYPYFPWPSQQERLTTQSQGERSNPTTGGAAIRPWQSRRMFEVDSGRLHAQATPVPSVGNWLSPPGWQKEKSLT